MGVAELAAPATVARSGYAGDAPVPGLPPDGLRPRRMPAWSITAILGIVLLFSVTTIGAMRQTSSTFDEILLPAAGARGYATGDFDLVKLYHPRLTVYLYGLPVLLSQPSLPAESDLWLERGGSFGYAAELFFRRGNDTEALVFRARLVAVALAAALILLTALAAGWVGGPAAAVLAAAMMAFLPDLIAHGGISYNDVPNALAILAAVLALDRMTRRPEAGSVSLAALATAAALGVKYSAVALAPVALVLITLEAIARGSERRLYLVQLLRLLPLALAVTYASLVVLYLGDFALASFRDGLAFNLAHASEGHGVPAWLLGRSDPVGFWYFFPAAFIIKTPAALHALILIGSVALLLKPVVGSPVQRRARDLLRSPLRGVVVGAAVFGAFLLASRLNIGFRHAMPVLPMLVIIAAVGLAGAWHASSTRIRALIAALTLVQAGCVLSWYPHFIPYTSEYFDDRDLGYTRLVDSSLDWGQGLPLLREFMETEDAPVVYLSYFGSADPAAYGIEYLPLHSFHALSGTGWSGKPPRYAAISATNLIGGYVNNDFAGLRHVEPYRVLGHTIFIYRVGTDDGEP